MLAAPQVPPDLVQDIMARGTFTTCQPGDSVDRALELLVENRVTGLPVVDANGRVVGMVSDFDLLALETFGRATSSRDMFPEAEQTWQAFKQVNNVLAKGTGKKVLEVMTCDPVTVKPDMSVDEATSLLIRKGIRHLPVVDDAGRLVGLLSRRDVVRAALHMRKGFCSVGERSGTASVE